MAAKKYLAQILGAITEVAATVVSAGAANDGDVVALNAQGKLDSSVLPTGVGAETKVLTTSEDLAAGGWVNIYDNAGTPTARKADATTAGKEAHGFVLASTTSGQDAVVYVAGINNQCTGLTGGETYFLATTAGGETLTPPSASGNVVQRLGQSLSDTEVAFEPGVPITLA
ncbi:hypothetical protein [Oceanidesulfovibrio marinus]|uniref:Uncharacterized protein n=1 Tax=Oceanidesulfovibrio marinus TaxID=370038 RepID=A0A6P1ZCS7_9BACT|nr:hypothetical protein [Oceanidesulfovibrio marinus]TVM31152.1 hypothetical protein DQK91_18755 [Oceanidesulfovibrio marinus]